MCAIRMYGWGDGGEGGGCDIVAGLTDRNVEIALFLAMFSFFLSNTMIKNENYSSQVLQSYPTVSMLEFTTQNESVGFRFYAEYLLKETMYKIMIFRRLKNLKCRCDGRQEGIYFVTFGSFLLIIILICGNMQYFSNRQCLVKLQSAKHVLKYVIYCSDIGRYHFLL